MLEREKRACTLPGDMNAGAVNDRVRTCKIDELKHAQLPGRLAAVADIGFDAGSVGHDDLAGQDVALKMGTDGVERAGLGGEHHTAIFEPAHTKRAEAMRVTHGDELTGRRDHERVSAGDAVHGRRYSRLDGAGLQPLLHDDVSDDLGVRSGMKD